jgi:lysophospholipase L1-like esterase
MRGRLAIAALGLCAAASVQARAPEMRLSPGDHYVAMGSSFAAGPGVSTSADTPANRCGRSHDNYAHQVAAQLGLLLTDVSCGGATTGHILGPWAELPPQLDALRPDTKLVTITIGGNDVGYIAGLFKGSCVASPTSPVCKGFAARASVPSPEPDEATWQGLETRLDQIAAEVHRRSPNAKLVFVDYLTILPSKSMCAAAPLDRVSADAARAKAARLAKLTARAARRGGASLVRASRLSMQHDACATAAWINGFPIEGSPRGMVGYHPNLAGMTAVARAIERSLKAR